MPVRSPWNGAGLRAPQADRLWERALQDGADFRELEDAIFEAGYGK